MNIRPFILCSTLLVATSLFARENTDVLVMKNGDHMTCHVTAYAAVRAAHLVIGSAPPQQGLDFYPGKRSGYCWEH
jgi:hypothetical protein